VIDYSGLEEDLTTLEDVDDVKKVEKTLEKQINELQSTINRIQVIGVFLCLFVSVTSTTKMFLARHCSKILCTSAV
jgi:hypothetical protein